MGDKGDVLPPAGGGVELAGTHGRFQFEPWTLEGKPYAIEPATISAAAALEQSDKFPIAYGMQAMAKIYRRLELGQNIEVDMNRYLAFEAGFQWMLAEAESDVPPITVSMARSRWRLSNSMLAIIAIAGLH